MTFTTVPASQGNAASSVPSPSAELGSSNTLSQHLAQSSRAFASAVPVGSAQSLGHPWFLQLGSGLPHKALLIQEFPSMQGTVCQPKEKLLCMWTGRGNSPGWLSSLSREYLWLSEVDLFYVSCTTSCPTSFSNSQDFLSLPGGWPLSAERQLKCCALLARFCIKLAPVSE